MKKLLKYKLLLFLLIVLSACVGEKDIIDATYFGGKIINPKDSHIFFFKGEELLDSTKLTEKNKFLFKFDSIYEGMYTFRHGPEVQFIFLEPNDSLLMRLNTWDFDESLVFSGKGADKNNLLANLFLINEKEEKLFYDYYKLNDSLFQLKIDSLLKEKQKLFSTLKEDAVDISPLYEKCVVAAMELPLYGKKEAYPYRHKKALRLKEYPHMNPKFYKFRKGIDLDDSDLYDLYAYHDYIKQYLIHLSTEQGIVDSNKNSFGFNFINVVVKNIKNKKLKNNFLMEGVWHVLLDNYTSKDQKDKAVKMFFEHSTNEKYNTEIKNLISANENLPNNTELPKLTVLNSYGNKMLINDVIKDTNAVIYFWPKSHRQIENMAKRVKYLKKQFPKILFVGIDANNPKWKSYIKSYKLIDKEQFKLDKNTDNNWLHLDHSRAILINKNGIVNRNFTHLSSNYFKRQLKNMIKH